MLNSLTKKVNFYCRETLRPLSYEGTAFTGFINEEGSLFICGPKLVPNSKNISDVNESTLLNKLTNNTGIENVSNESRNPDTYSVMMVSCQLCHDFLKKYTENCSFDSDFFRSLYSEQSFLPKIFF